MYITAGIQFSNNFFSSFPITLTMYILPVPNYSKFLLQLLLIIQKSFKENTNKCSPIHLIIHSFIVILIFPSLYLFLLL